jgi:hypothetical protein
MKAVVAIFISVFLFSVVSCFGGLVYADTNDSSFPLLTMPVEYVNYTITEVNGTLWAKIDGIYPMTLLNQSNLAMPFSLPMVYPTPPQTTNITIKLDDKVVDYTDYSQEPGFLHHTAIGDWTMIYSVLKLNSTSFVLKIHYEHPLQMVNGSYLFLYDLNISPYLSTANNNSTAYFTVRMETNYTNLQAYTTETDAKWNPINYTVTKEGSMDIVSIVMHSEYSKPLLGDLVVQFSGSEIPEYPYLGVVVVAAVFSTLALVYIKSKRYHAKPTLKFEQNS